MTTHGQGRKVKKSFRISLESGAFLKRMRKGAQGLVRVRDSGCAFA
jgi:hypothetical protein